MTASLLPIPDDLRFHAWIRGYPDCVMGSQWPRSSWLAGMEVMLREFYPQANSRSLSLTARHAAPFYLRDGPNVP